MSQQGRELKLQLASRIRKVLKFGINGFFFRVTEIIFQSLFSYQPCFYFMDLTFNRIPHRQNWRQWLSTVGRDAHAASMEFLGLSTSVAPEKAGRSFHTTSIESLDAAYF